MAQSSPRGVSVNPFLILSGVLLLVVICAMAVTGQSVWAANVFQPAAPLIELISVLYLTLAHTVQQALTPAFALLTPVLNNPEHAAQVCAHLLFAWVLVLLVLTRWLALPTVANLGLQGVVHLCIYSALAHIVPKSEHTSYAEHMFMSGLVYFAAVVVLGTICAGLISMVVYDWCAEPAYLIPVTTLWFAPMLLLGTYFALALGSFWGAVLGFALSLPLYPLFSKLLPQPEGGW